MLKILTGDCMDVLPTLAADSVQCCVMAYLAGVIDSDGTIGIKRNTYAMRVVGDCSAATYSERICVKQVSPEAIGLLKETFGGCYYKSAGQNAKSKPLHVWQITDKKAALAIKQLLPFLRIKSAQARNCIRLREFKDRSKILRVAKGRGHAGSAARSSDLTAAMELCYSCAKNLNRIGKEE